MSELAAEPAHGPRVEAVVVSYNVRELLLRCLASLRADGVERVVVVDNDSKDGSAEAARGLPGVEVVALSRNLGFAAGANRGVARTTSDYVAVVNPDEVVRPGCTAALAAALDADPGLGVVGPRLLTVDGRTYPSARTFPDLVVAAGHAFGYLVWPDNPFSRRYRMTDWDHESARDVDWLAGTHLLVRRDAWEAVGGFDEGYFMYLEDVDLCWRLHEAGWRVRYVPAAEAVHDIGRSTDQRPYRMIAAHHRSLVRYATRTMRGPQRLLLPLAVVSIGVRLVLAWAHRFTRRRPHAAL